MKAISVEDRVKIQSHLAEIWKILYANGLEDKEHQRTPNSKQKERMSQMNITFNKDHSALTDGFQLLVGTHSSCWHEISFDTTKEEEDCRKHRNEAIAIKLKRNERKLKRQHELEEEHHVAYWHKEFMTPCWTSGYGDIRYSKQNDEGTLSYVGPRPDRFVWWLFHGANADGKEFTTEAREKYMKKYGLDKDYDVKTGKLIKADIDVVEVKKEDVEVKKEDKAKQVKDYLRKKFEDGSWKDEANESMLSMNEMAIEEYLDTVREFIRQQEELDLHGIALYAINNERTNAHEALLDEYGFNSNDEKSEIARDVTKSIDFVGECKIIDGKMKTVFYPVYEALLRLAYALDVVEHADEYLKG